MNIIDQESCLREHVDFEYIASERTFCGKAEQAGPCFGDSGSGFYVQHDHVWFLEGITSASLTRDGECDVTNNAVFTTVSNFTGWIAENVGPTITTKPVKEIDANYQLVQTTQAPPKQGNSLNSMFDNLSNIGRFFG